MNFSGPLEVEKRLIENESGDEGPISVGCTTWLAEFPEEKHGSMNARKLEHASLSHEAAMISLEPEFSAGGCLPGDVNELEMAEDMETSALKEEESHTPFGDPLLYPFEDTTYEYDEPLFNDMLARPYPILTQLASKRTPPTREAATSKRGRRPKQAAAFPTDHLLCSYKAKVLAQNRVAAAKHREKKRKARVSLCQSFQEGEVVNKDLKRLSEELRTQLAYWRTLALQHGGAAGCQCEDIQQYNAVCVERLLLPYRVSSSD